MRAQLLFHFTHWSGIRFAPTDGSCSTLISRATMTWTPSLCVLVAMRLKSLTRSLTHPFTPLYSTLLHLLTLFHSTQLTARTKGGVDGRTLRSGMHKQRTICCYQALQTCTNAITTPPCCSKQTTTHAHFAVLDAGLVLLD